MKYFTINASWPAFENFNAEYNNRRQHIKQIMRIGFFSIALLLTSLQLLLALPVKSQKISSVEVRLELRNETLLSAFKQIEKQTPFRFVYRKAELIAISAHSIDASTYTVEQALKLLLQGTDFSYKQVGSHVLIISSYQENKLVETDHDVADIVVRGQVKGASGETLPGVSVKVKGSTVGTSTDVDGRFSLSVPENSILVFSYIGHVIKEVAVNNQSPINITLASSATALTEVVVTALGIQRETKSLTYSTQSVNTQQLSEARELNILASLGGKVAGLSITSSGGGVGSGVRVVLRGNRSIDGDSQPLYVIDGVLGVSPTDISPDNIASVNVLKGANASALYGSAAQNGAIIIETKKGVIGSRLSINQNFMAQDPYKLLPFQNVYGQGYGGVYSNNAEAAWGPKMDGQMVKTWSQDPADLGKTYAFLPQTNNKSDIFQNGYNMSTNLTASMGAENIQALFSYTYTDAKGILPNNDLKRHNISMRINSKLSSKLSLDSKIEYKQQGINNITNQGLSNANPIEQIYTMPPNISSQDLLHYEFTDLNGNKRQNWWNPSSQTGENVYWVLNNAQNRNSNVGTLLMTSLTYSFSDAINLMVRASYNGSTNNSNQKLHNDTYNIAAFGNYSEGKGQDMSLNSDFLLSYAPNISKNWSIKANVGGSTLKNRESSIFSSTGLAMLVPNLFSLSNTNMPTTSSSPEAGTNKNSLYAFTSIGWKNSLFFDITGRNDWSSTLPEKNRSYFYPSVGMSAVLSDLIPTLPKVISFAKLRVSFAEVGQDTRPFMLQRNAYTGPGGINGFLQLSGLVPNPNLLPEKTSSSEIGLDIRLFNGRIGLDATAYKTNTKNQIFQLSLPVGSGASTYFTNGGDVQNKGIEVVLSTIPVKTTNFKWDVNVNFAANRNKVIKISDASPKIIVPANDSYFKDFVIEQGAPYGQLYGKGWKRDAQNRVMIDNNGLPLLTDGRSVLLANFNPKWTGGIMNAFSYRNLSLGFVIETRQGGTMVSASNAIIDGLGLSDRTLEGRAGDLVFGKNLFGNEKAVLANGTTNNIPITAEGFWSYVGGVNAPTGEPFVISATNTRLRELTIGYSVPKSLLDNIHLADAKISLVGRNLLFISRASPYADPDIMLGTDKTSEGFQSFNPPSSRYYGLNLKIGFK